MDLGGASMEMVFQTKQERNQVIPETFSTSNATRPTIIQKKKSKVMNPFHLLSLIQIRSILWTIMGYLDCRFGEKKAEYERRGWWQRGKFDKDYTQSMFL